MSSPSGRFIRGVLSFALVAMMLASVASTPASAAAQASSVQSQLTGVTISYAPPYVLQPDASYADDVLETMMFVGSADILAMGFMSPLIDLNGARDIMLESLFGDLGTTVTIDRGNYTGVSYSLDMLNFEGSEMGVFSLFMNQRSHGFAEFYIFIAPPVLFGPSMQVAQNSFTINGSPLMDGVDSTVMGNMITANVGTTGGTAVTDVTDVTNTSETTDTTTTSTTETTNTASSADASAYLDTISAQRQDFLDSFATFNDALSVFGVDTATDADRQAAAQVMLDQGTYWSGFSEQAAQLTAPAGYESVHIAYLAWASEITDLGMIFVGIANQEGPTFEDFDVQLEAVSAADDELVAQVNTARDSGGSTTDTTTGTDTGSSRSTRSTSTGTESTTATADAPDGAAYVETLTAQRAEFMGSFNTFAESLAVFGDETATDQQKQAALGTMTEQATYWTTFNERAQGVTAPAGYEDLHAMYLTWSDEITTLGVLWVGATTQQGPTLDDFFAQLDVVNGVDVQFRDTLAETSTTGTGTTETTQATEVATETTSGDSTSAGEAGSSNTRSTRSTSSSTDTDSTETSTRSTRSTSSSSSTDTSTRTTRSTRGSDAAQTENTSETQGRTSSSRSTSGSSAGNEWYMELNDVTITWGDDFSLNPNSDPAQVSDPEADEDKIYLTWNESDLAPVPMTITVFPNGTGDSTSFITLLTDDASSLQDIFGTGAEVVDSEIDAEASAMLVRAEDDQGEYFVYVQVTCINTGCTTVAMTLIANEGLQVSDAVGAAESSVTIEGMPIAGALPATIVENAILESGN